MPAFGADGQPCRYIAIGTDITHARAAAATVMHSERRYRAAVDTLNAVVFRTDAEGPWTFLNPAWRALGLCLGDSVGRCFMDFVDRRDRAAVRAGVARLMAGQRQSTRHEARYLSADATVRWLGLYPCRVSPGTHACGLSGSLAHIIERHRATRQLQENLRFVATLVESIPLLFYLKDDAGRYLRVNGAVARLFGVEAATLPCQSAA